MSIILEHPDALIHIAELQGNKKRITISPLDKSVIIYTDQCETFYPLWLIKQILDILGPAGLCDEIKRDENISNVEKSLKNHIFGYVNDIDFENKRILDFGCGGGASTMILARMFPKSSIVGVELVGKSLLIANCRLKHYGYTNVTFIRSPAGDSLPEQIGKFDFVILNGVYEHLLPNERKMLLPKIWTLINPGGILFLATIPYRYFPIETHTTGGLPFINYLPDRMAFALARTFSKRLKRDESDNALLRKGIRGGSSGEIIGILEECHDKPLLMEPCKSGYTDKIDLWYADSAYSKFPVIKVLLKFFFKIIKSTFGFTCLPYLSLAIKKV